MISLAPVVEGGSLPSRARRAGSARRCAMLLVLTVLTFPGETVAAGKPSVAGVQVALRAHGLNPGSVDGVTGRLTVRAIRAFQRRAGLRASGRPDRRTLAALGSLGRPSFGTRNLARRSRGRDVAELQFLLATHGFPSGRFDGVFGVRTEQALRRYQATANLAPDGTAGRATYIALHAPPPRSPRTLAWPVRGVVGSRFGPRAARFHAGIDIAAPVGTPVTAAGGGRVTWAGWRAGGWGKMVTVAHGDGLRTIYAHLSRVRVRLGQRLTIGETIGLVGRTAVRFDAAHLHFELRVRGAATDPLTALGDGRARSASSSERSPTVQRASVRRALDYWARRYRVDPRLVRALAWMESGYQPRAVSHSGAIGVMQVMPETWVFVERALIGAPVAPTMRGNIRVGVAYLRHLVRAFGGVRLALAAYNQGPRALREQGVFPETEAFVEDVLALRARM